MLCALCDKCYAISSLLATKVTRKKNWNKESARHWTHTIKHSQTLTTHIPLRALYIKWIDCILGYWSENHTQRKNILFSYGWKQHRKRIVSTYTRYTLFNNKRILYEWCIMHSHCFHVNITDEKSHPFFKSIARPNEVVIHYIYYNIYKWIIWYCVECTIQIRKKYISLFLISLYNLILVFEKSKFVESLLNVEILISNSDMMHNLQ